MGGVRRLRVLGAVVVTVLLALAPAAAWAGAGTDDAAERAAREITAARERANAVAEELWTTQSAHDLLVEEEDRLRGELERVQLEVDALRENVESIAVTRFVASGSEGIPLLTDVRAPNERVRADVLVGVVADVGASALDDFEAARVELATTALELERTQQASVRQQERLERLRVDAEAEVQRLREIEEQRLQDDAVRRALEARQREEQREREESERRAAEAALRAEADAAAELAAVPAPARRVEPTGGTDGGRTGASGGGSTPAASFVDAIVCPVIGGSAWGDTWGAPRSGGRRHQGVDMLAPIGTPLVAVVSGLAQHRSNRLGGITVSLLGDNGTTYYYAHLDAYEGPEGRVGQGQVIGYVGDTGNATGVPHLHFEVRPNGGVPVNPTPSVRAAGC